MCSSMALPLLLEEVDSSFPPFGPGQATVTTSMNRICWKIHCLASKSRLEKSMEQSVLGLSGHLHLEPSCPVVGKPKPCGEATCVLVSNPRPIQHQLLEIQWQIVVIFGYLECFLGERERIEMVHLYESRPQPGHSPALSLPRWGLWHLEQRQTVPTLPLSELLTYHISKPNK